jgi:hypothetical protein
MNFQSIRITRTLVRISFSNYQIGTVLRGRTRRFLVLHLLLSIGQLAPLLFHRLVSLVLMLAVLIKVVMSSVLMVTVMNSRRILSRISLIEITCNLHLVFGYTRMEVGHLYKCEG